MQISSRLAQHAGSALSLSLRQGVLTGRETECCRPVAFHRDCHAKPQTSKPTEKPARLSRKPVLLSVVAVSLSQSRRLAVSDGGLAGSFREQLRSVPLPEEVAEAAGRGGFTLGLWMQGNGNPMQVSLLWAGVPGFEAPGQPGLEPPLWSPAHLRSWLRALCRNAHPCELFPAPRLFSASWKSRTSVSNLLGLYWSINCANSVLKEFSNNETIFTEYLF